MRRCVYNIVINSENTEEFATQAQQFTNYRKIKTQIQTALEKKTRNAAPQIKLTSRGKDDI